MSKKQIDEIIDIGIPAFDNNLRIPYGEIISLINKGTFKSEYKKMFNRYIDYLSMISGGHLINDFPKTLEISANVKTHEQIFKFSLFSFMRALMLLFDVFYSNNHEGTPSERLKNAIEYLKNINTKEELKQKYPTLYEIFTKIEIENYDNKWIVPYYEKMTFSELVNYRKDNNEKRIDVDKIYLDAKMATDISFFSRTISKSYSDLFSKILQIEMWLRNNSLKIKLNQEDLRKLSLYLIFREIENLSDYLLKGENVKAQKNVIIIENMIKKHELLYPNNNNEVSFFRDQLEANEIYTISSENKISISFGYVKELFENLIKKYPYLIVNLSLPTIDENLNSFNLQTNINDYIRKILNDTIKQNIEDGAKEVEEKVVVAQIEELESEIRNKSITDKELNIKKMMIKKIQMVLNDIKPLSIQTGIGVFSDYYIYFYPNGMVAIDKMGYGALYLMPVHVYKEVRYKKNLMEVRSIPGVKYVTHKSKNWLDNAKDIINNGTDHLTEKDIKEAEFISSIDFPYTLEEMDKLQKSLEDAHKDTDKVKEEIEKRKRRIKKLEDIDSELKSNSEEKEDESADKLNEEVEELIDSNILTFEELYEFWKSKHESKKVKRNPAVAEYTKERTKDEAGNYCCELCEATKPFNPDNPHSFDHSAFDSHHVIPLHEGGIDNIYNTVCLCRNCHGYVHSRYMTLNQRYILFDIIRKHIEEENPEYLVNFEEMISPYSKDDNYEQNKNLVERNFAMVWNNELPSSQR